MHPQRLAAGIQDHRIPRQPHQRVAQAKFRRDRVGGQVTGPNRAAMAKTSAAPSITSERGIGVSAYQAHRRSTARDSGDSFATVACQVVITGSG